MAELNQKTFLGVENWWEVHAKIMSTAVALMAVTSLVWLGYEFYRLLWQPNHIGDWQVHPGAIDFKIYQNMVQSWFDGQPIYKYLKAATYPPASYVILWPLVGWLEMNPALYLWTMTTLAVLGWLVYLVVRESGANTPLERIFVALIPLSIYPTGATIGNGQLILHLLPMLISGIILVHRGTGGWAKNLLGSFLILITLVKPSVSMLFLWIVLFGVKRWGPVFYISSGYIALTILGASFQNAGLISLFQDWLIRSSEMAVSAGHANLHAALAVLGLRAWLIPTSLIVFLLLGFWVYFHRKIDVWVLMGVVAIVSRFWVYHRWYDDLLILLPMVTLFRIAKMSTFSNGRSVFAGLLLGVTLITIIAPGGLYLLPPPWNMRYVGFQIIVWLLVLIFLLNHAYRQKRQWGHDKGA